MRSTIPQTAPQTATPKTRPFGHEICGYLSMFLPFQMLPLHFHKGIEPEILTFAEQHTWIPKPRLELAAGLTTHVGDPPPSCPPSLPAVCFRLTPPFFGLLPPEHLALEVETLLISPPTGDDCVACPGNSPLFTVSHWSVVLAAVTGKRLVGRDNSSRD